MHHNKSVPVCYDSREYCFAERRGLCIILTDTDFKRNTRCPFYDTKEDYEKKIEAANQRLRDIGEEHLIHKYTERGKV